MLRLWVAGIQWRIGEAFFSLSSSSFCIAGRPFCAILLPIVTSSSVYGPLQSLMITGSFSLLSYFFSSNKLSNCNTTTVICLSYFYPFLIQCYAHWLVGGGYRLYLSIGEVRLLSLKSIFIIIHARVHHPIDAIDFQCQQSIHWEKNRTGRKSHHLCRRTTVMTAVLKRKLVRRISHHLQRLRRKTSRATR